MYHRLYRNVLPKEGDIVVVKITSVDDLGAKCELLEYGGIEGMMPATEYTRKSVRSLKKLIQPGKQEVLCVISVDDEKNYVDLSKKRVTSAEITTANAKYYKSNFVNSIMKYLSNNIDDSMSVLYEKMCWDMDDEYGDSYTALELASKDSTKLDKYDIETDIKSSLSKILSLRFADQPKTVFARIEVSCLGKDGVNAIKESLEKAKSFSKEDLELKVNVIKCPEYSISANGIDTVEITKIITNAIEAVKASIESYELGSFVLLEPIKVY